MKKADIGKAQGLLLRLDGAALQRKQVVDHLNATASQSLTHIGLCFTVRPDPTGRSTAITVVGAPGKAALNAMVNCLGVLMEEIREELRELGVELD